MSLHYFMRSGAMAAAMLTAPISVHAASYVAIDIANIIDDGGLKDQDDDRGTIGVSQFTVNATARFFEDELFNVLHSLSLSGPAYPPGLSPPDPSLAGAGYLDGAVTVDLYGDFDYRENFAYWPRGRIGGHIYFPNAGGAVDVFFGIKVLPPSLIASDTEPTLQQFDDDFVPFYQQTVTNPGGAGTLVAFGGTGRVLVGPLNRRAVVPVRLRTTSIDGTDFSLWLPNSLHVDFAPDGIPEPATAVLLGLGGAVILRMRHRLHESSPVAPRRSCIVALLSLLPSFLDAGAGSAAAAMISTVPVADPGNANDSTGFGGVDYAYRIAKHEVTNDQYAEFLNAKAASDPLSLYGTNMGADARGGITRSGVSGSFSYATKANMGDKPVNFVGWYDAIRFANWLHNGQGTGDTETGAYTLLGGGATPSNGPSVTRNSAAVWFLPSENEWYKAAYYDPRTAAEGGPPGDDHYWFYPTASDNPPTLALANGVGNIANPGANVANVNDAADWNSQNGNVTTVGSAGPLSSSFYGTSDQGGNVWEWNEGQPGSTFRRIRGGSWQDLPQFMSVLNPQDIVAATIGVSDLGFRVATVVPEPGWSLISALAIGLAATWRVAPRSNAGSRSTFGKETLP